MLPTDWISRALAAAIHVAAGGCVFLALYNRRLLFIHSRWIKRVAVLAALVTLGLAPTVGGWTVGLSPWTALPGLILLGAGVEEWLLIRTRRRHRGLPTQRSIRLHRPVTTTDLDVIRYDWSCPGWTGPGFKIVHISDLHAGQGLPESYLEHLQERVSREQPDLLFVTGDFVTVEDQLPELPALLEPLQASLGCFGILGNHDFWAGAERVTAAAEQAGIRMLGHGSVQVAVSPGHQITLCGCEQPWNDAPWEAPGDTGDPLLVLTHTADNIYRLSRAGATAAFAGHYHGGQFQLPGFGPIVLPSAFGRRFPHGHFVINRTHLFISAGAGVARPPVRLYCPPDILVVNVQAGNTPCREPDA